MTNQIQVQKQAQGAMHCPVCGSLVAKVPVDAVADARLSKHERVLVEELIRIYPRATTMEHLIDCLYGNHPNGGPDSADQVIRVHISRLRRKLGGFGWTVTKACVGSGAHSNYKLEQILALCGNDGA